MADDGKESKKPFDSAFQQQKLKAWQPLLTPNWVIGTFFIVGLVFLPVGIVVLDASNKVVEVTARYDQLKADPLTNLTTVTLTIPSTMKAPIFFYYRLTNFYQNHRRYVKSRSDSQLNGGTPSDITSCDPLETYGGKKLYPCGLIANSMFNDTFKAVLTPSSGGTPMPLTGDHWDGNGIAWKSDKSDKFKLRAPQSSETSIGPSGSPVWTETNNEDFIVWMRTAGLPTFKKLHRKINNLDLEKGDTLVLSIKSVFPVSGFDGEKAVVLSTTSWLGGKNSFLGWAYIVVGATCLVLALLFVIKQRTSPRPLGDMKYFNVSGAFSKAPASRPA